MSDREEINATREEEINALWEKYQKVFYVYWRARCKAVDEAIASVSDLQAVSAEAYEVYRLARHYPRAARSEAHKAKLTLLEGLTGRLPWPSFRAVGRRIFRRKK